MSRVQFRSVVLILLLTGIAGQSAHAQLVDTWKNVAPTGSFHKTIGCGYFFDEDHGLIGSGVRLGSYGDGASPVSIYKTVDGGANWTEAIIPKQILGAVTAISMVDTLVGYASIFSDENFDDDSTFGKSALWKTTDGGWTWFDDMHLDHIATCVYAQNGFLMYTKWDWYYTHLSIPPLDDFGGAYSTDDGVNWTESFRRGNGIDFVDSIHGVMSEMNAPASNFWFTSDAGRNWLPTTDQFESWSVYGVKGTSMYFCANESQMSLNHNTVNWSTDYGVTWRQRASFPYMRFTGTIAGKGNTLYFQTDTTRDISFSHGIYRSDDLGLNWHYVSGPSNSRDTRFVVTGCMGEVVYAFDGYGGVWKTIDGGDGTLPGAASLTQSVDTINWLPAPCGDTISYSVAIVSCLPITIDSVRPFRGTELFVGYNGVLPQQMVSGDSSKISIVYSPSKSGESLSIVRIYAHAGLSHFVRDLSVRIRSNAPSGMVLSSDSVSMTVGGCASAFDTVQIENVGCPGLVFDSISYPPGEVVVLNAFPDTVGASGVYQMRFGFSPDSAGVHQVAVHLFAHDGRLRFDTIIAITASSTKVPLELLLDSASLAFATMYCRPAHAMLSLATTGCDSLLLDSIFTSNPSFALEHVPAAIPSGARDSLVIQFAPDSIGPTSGIVRLFAHANNRSIDTTIVLTGFNTALPQAMAMSRTTVSLATSACRAALDSLTIHNQGCDALYLDSVIDPDIELRVSYDPSRLPIASGDSMSVHVLFSPSDGLAKSTPVRLRMHTVKRQFDTTIVVNTTNAIPGNPLSLSTDSLLLRTKYCQPVSIPLTVRNFGCDSMQIDSVNVVGDSLHEFQYAALQSIASQDSVSTTVFFTPARGGRRSAQLRLFTRGGHEIDTVIPLQGSNVLAPEPYLPVLPSLAAGKILRIPIMLRPTTDTFSMQSFAVHLSLNTDLLTPFGLDFGNTCAKRVKSASLTVVPGKGVSIRITLLDTISDTSQLGLPIVYVLDSVRIAPDTTTLVVLDTFVTDREPALVLCSLSAQPFVLQMPCGDEFLWQFMSLGSFDFSIKSVTPNPASTEASWKVVLDVQRAEPNLGIDLCDARGVVISHTNCPQSLAGEFTVPVALPSAEGDYFLVARGSRGVAVKKVTVRR